MMTILTFNIFCTPVILYAILSPFSYFQLSLNLFQVHVLLRSSNWDTRVAASQAIEAIVKNVPSWEPIPIKTEGNCLRNSTSLNCAIFIFVH